ncbi:hypothetical protein FRUB_02597 [Fimbriiglobus ruber]|uniref:Uncharacterized protein n=2 Tax=Fimbriiglobus ruber TaxID=1908690 RepID=A0A225DWY6_9BACT|nr:hypothetical protein FRUB_02597 [Fimbriiglobus ruber]
MASVVAGSVVVILMLFGGAVLLQYLVTPAPRKVRRKPKRYEYDD